VLGLDKVDVLHSDDDFVLERESGVTKGGGREIFKSSRGEGRIIKDGRDVRREGGRRFF
jgi:hypothetical protein